MALGQGAEVPFIEYLLSARCDLTYFSHHGRTKHKLSNKCSGEAEKQKMALVPALGP